MSFSKIEIFHSSNHALVSVNKYLLVISENFPNMDTIFIKHSVQILILRKENNMINQPYLKLWSNLYLNNGNLTNTKTVH